MNHTVSNLTSRINLEINAPQMLFDGKCYLDFSTLKEITKLTQSKLHRTLKSINDLEQYSIVYKNRIYYDQGFITIHFRYLL